MIERFQFDYPLNDGSQPLGYLQVHASYWNKEVTVDHVFYHHNGYVISLTGLIECYCDDLGVQLQYAAENQAADLGFKVRSEDPRETELSEILKP